MRGAVFCITCKSMSKYIFALKWSLVMISSFFQTYSTIKNAAGTASFPGGIFYVTGNSGEFSVAQKALTCQ